jgi:DNA-binding transcriptional MerR regulator
MADSILTTSAAARALGIPEGQLRTLTDKGLVPFQRDSSNRRIFTQQDVARGREVVAQRKQGKAP